MGQIGREDWTLSEERKKREEKGQKEAKTGSARSGMTDYLLSKKIAEKHRQYGKES
jgi:hypothetical protein